MIADFSVMDSSGDMILLIEEGFAFIGHGG